MGNRSGKLRVRRGKSAADTCEIIPFVEDEWFRSATGGFIIAKACCARSIGQGNPRDYSDDISPTDFLTNLRSCRRKRSFHLTTFLISTFRVIFSRRCCYSFVALAKPEFVKNPRYFRAMRESLREKIERDRALHHFQLARSAEYSPLARSLGSLAAG